MATPQVDFDVMAFFKEEVKNESAAIRIAAINKVHLVAFALGPTKCINDLIPFLSSLVKEEPHCNDDEFLYTMAKQYVNLHEYIDGHDEVLMPLLEHLASQDETVIREQAINSMCHIVESKHSLVPEHLVPILHRLATKSDVFTGRISACALMPTVYRYANEDQKDTLRKTHTTLCTDDSPMVRRAVALKMRDFIMVCDKSDISPDLIGVYRQLSQEDTQDIIRVSSVHTTLVMAKKLTQEDNKQYTLQVIKDAAEDRSWRVRLTVASHFDQLCTAFGPEITNNYLLQPFVQLMKDNEQEVRKEAVRNIEACLTMPHPFTTEQLTSVILPQFTAVGTDPAQPVRAALAQIMGPVAKTLGRDITQRFLLSLISDLMKDDFHDVRLNIVSHAGLIFEVLCVDGVVQSLLSLIQNLIADNHWRIRQSVVEQIPKLAVLLGVDMFQEKLESLFLASLRDSVHSVRETAIKHLKDITDCFGCQWTTEHLFPKLVEQYSQSAGYANRVTTLHVLPQVSGVMTTEQINQYIVPLLVKATKDNVPNVKFCACRTIQWFLENRANASIGSQVKSELLVLKQDPDSDVVYFAQRALSACE